MTSVFCVINDDEPRGWTTDDLVDSVKDVAERERLVGPVLSVHFDAAESVESEVSISSDACFSAGAYLETMDKRCVRFGNSLLFDWAAVEYLGED